MVRFKVLVSAFVFVLLMRDVVSEQNHVSITDYIRGKRSTSSQSTTELFGDYYDDPQEADNCTRLPPNIKRSKVSHEHNISFTSLMEGGLDNMVNFSKNKDVILIMGNTGVGKTVITQILAGDLNHIHAVKTHTGELVIVDDFERISAPSIISRTLVPELVVKNYNGSNLAFYDCPGFDDTRGPIQDVATNFFINQIISKVSRVKILFLILQSSVTLGHDRVDFDSMVQHATKFIKNVDQFKDSIAIVVTKAKNYSDSGKYMRDGNVKKKILEFLMAYKSTLENSLITHVGEDSSKRTNIRKKIEFVNALLEKDSSGKYSKISFSRDPEKCGPLSSSSEVANTKERIENMYSALSYSNVGNSNKNFGFSLKSDTVLQIRNIYIPELNNGTFTKISEQVDRFKIWFRKEKVKKVDDQFSSIVLSATRVDPNRITIGDLLTQKNQNFGNFSINSTVFSSTLINEFNMVRYTISDDFVSFMEKQDGMFEFFQQAIDYDENVRRISDWIIPLSNLRDTIASEYIPEVNDRVVLGVEKLVRSFDKWLNNVKLNGIHNSSSVVVPENLDFSKLLALTSRSRIKNELVNSGNFGSALENVLKPVGFAVSERFIKFMENQDIFFDFFQSFVGTTANARKVSNWVSPLTSLKNNISSKYVPELNERVVQEVTKVTDQFENWFNTLKAQDVSNYSTSLSSLLYNKVEKACLHVDKVIAINRISRSNSPSITLVKFIEVLEAEFNKIGFFVPQTFVQSMTIQNGMFNIYGSIVGHDVQSISEWSVPISNLHAKMLDYKSWYGFCANVQNTLSSYSFHASKYSSNLADAKQNWFRFIERNQIFGNISQNIINIYSQYNSTSKPVQLLNYMMTYSLDPVSVTCSGTTVTVKGSFVRFGDFLKTNGGMGSKISSCCRGKLAGYTIEVYASNTIFIDTDFDGAGLDVELVMISPKWVVIQQRHLNFIGQNGRDIYPIKASQGYSGKAGIPGGPGGAFFGIAGKVDNNYNLKVTLDGGRGGAGQDGGNGQKGYDGKPPQVSDTWYGGRIITLVWNEHWRRFEGHPGNPGNDGMDGGVGGIGGLPGKLYLKSLSGDSYLGVRISQNNGITGRFGRGGLGGDGGNPGKGLYCQRNNIFGIRLSEFKCNEENSSLSKANKGRNGYDNFSELDLKQPIASKHEIDIRWSASRFRTIFTKVMDVDCKNFAESLKVL